MRSKFENFDFLRDCQYPIINALIKRDLSCATAPQAGSPLRGDWRSLPGLGALV